MYGVGTYSVYEDDEPVAQRVGPALVGYRPRPDDRATMTDGADIYFVKTHKRRKPDGYAAILRARSCPFVVVVGHPEYYPRFGFDPASVHGLVSQWEGVPDAAFMVLILDEHAMTGISGVAM